MGYEHEGGGHVSLCDLCPPSSIRGGLADDFGGDGEGVDGG
jgi:hypothetical protein